MLRCAVYCLRAFPLAIVMGIAEAQVTVRTFQVEPTGEYAKIDVASSNQAMKTLLHGDTKEKSDMAKRVIAASDQFTPPVLYALASMLFEAGRKDEAVFWFYAGQVRGRFDATICADKTAGSGIGVLNQQFGPPINEYAGKDPQKLKKIVQRVIKWDEKTPYNYDHRWINLHGLGGFTGEAGASLSVDEKTWPEIARTNREKAWAGVRTSIGDNPEDYFTDPNVVGLARAAAVGNAAGIAKYIKAGAEVNAVGKDGASVLWFTMLAGNKAGFARLLELGADPTRRFELMRMSVAYMSVARSDDSYLELLLKAKFDPNTVLSETKKPLIFETVGFGGDSKLRLLIAHKADMNARDESGGSALMAAGTLWQFGKILTLLEHGADPAIRNQNGQDVAMWLFIAGNLTPEANYQRLQVIEKLKERGYVFDEEIIAKARIQNLDEATGKAPPRFFKDSKEPNPEWVKANAGKTGP
ncbi:MAG: hypothetical protein V4773_13215 [Verrucomicrobiota bacterium]